MVVTLATNDTGDYTIATLLKHGKGTYIITAVQNEDQGQVNLNLPFIENLLFYAAALQNELLAVQPNSKLSVT